MTIALQRARVKSEPDAQEGIYLQEDLRIRKPRAAQWANWASLY